MSARVHSESESMAITRAEPLSIESLLQKQKEEREAASKVRSPHGPRPRPPHRLASHSRNSSPRSNAQRLLSRNAHRKSASRRKRTSTNAQSGRRSSARLLKSAQENALATLRRTEVRSSFHFHLTHPLVQTTTATAGGTTGGTIGATTDAAAVAMTAIATTASQAAELRPQVLAPRAALRQVLLPTRPPPLPRRRQRSSMPRRVQPALRLPMVQHRMSHQ